MNKFFNYLSFLIFNIFLSGLLLSGCSNQKSTPQNESFDPEPPSWSYDDTIYELNVRQFSEEGTFEAVTERVKELSDLGVDIIWLMPIHPIGEKNRKGELGSYYAVKDYKAINPEFGTLEDFKELVKTIHEHDMHVILDWVANHTAWDHKWTETNPDYYTKDEDGNFVPPVEDWSDVIDLNYENDAMRQEMKDALTYWVEEAGVDGYRCDVAGMVPLDFWKSVRKELDAIKPVFMLAEDEGPEMHKAFDMTYGWEFHHIMNEIAAGEKNASDVWNYLQKERPKFPKNAFRMYFTTNHDENSWNGTVFERLGDGVRTFAALTFTMEGMPLIYSGQEAGMDKRLEFFERDPINWSDPNNFRNFYNKLITLKEENNALQNGARGGVMKRLPELNNENILAFVREKEDDSVFVILNLSGSNETVAFTPDISAGSYTNIINGDKVEFSAGESYTIPLEPWEYRVFAN